MSVKEEIAPVSASQTAAPPSLLDEIMAQTRVQPKSESYDITRQGVSAFIAAMLQGDSSAEPINILAVDAMIADIDARTSRQMDAIIHAPEFQELESLLRSLKLLVERADTRENIKVHFLNVTQEELLDDFEFAPEITQSAYYKHVYSSGYGQFGGEPVAAVIGNFAFKNTTPDMKLLKYISQVSAMAHSPFLSSVSSEFFGLDSWTELPGIKEPGAIFEGPAYSRWRALRESEDSRYLGLTAPGSCCATLTHRMKTLSKPSVTMKMSARVMSLICGEYLVFTVPPTWRKVLLSIAGAQILLALPAAAQSKTSRCICMNPWGKCRQKFRLKC